MKDPLINLLAGRRGHFEMESGYHTEWWFELDALFKRPEQLRPFVAELARRLVTHRVDAVCGPMTGGAKLARLIAAELGVAYHFSERFEQSGATGLFPIRYIIPAAQRESLRGKTVAIVDDAVSAGSAARGTYADLVECGAQPVALGALFVFGDAAQQFAADKSMALEGIAMMPLGIWKPEDCPHCRAGRAVERVLDAV
jgi:orotate phosphoribosyltransferase